MHPAISINRLTFAYNEKKILDNVSLKIDKGSFSCLLGENGSGKSTIIKIITGQLDYKIGEVKVLGNEVRENKYKIKKCLGILSDNIVVPGEFTVKEALIFSAKAIRFNSKKAESITKELIDYFNLSCHSNTLIKKLSTGLRRRVEIAQALVNNGDIIVLDEPTNGLDPNSSEEIRALIKKIHQKGATIIYSTHLLNEINNLYTNISIISNGKIRTFDRIELMKNNNKIIIRFINRQQLKMASELLKHKNIEHSKENLLLLINSSDININTVLNIFRSNNIHVAETSVGQINLNMLYNNYK
jgi:ABC-2 type transport system ATP-binding protein